ncbi:hypothetical protein [Embleya sp. NPDC005971]|uniref:hypothetical protein n=1 Tax=Embleya sp. NPDC005971 TaxID=3156724 RepID=UPI0033E9D25F
MEPEYDPTDFKASDYATVRDVAERVGVTEAAVRKWIERQGITAVGRYPFPDNRKIYRAVDLETAELATRLRAPDRAVPEIAGWQRLMRAERQQRTEAA